jgi:hypothetical protein
MLIRVASEVSFSLSQISGSLQTVAERGQKTRGGEFHREHKLGTKNGQVTEQIPG